MRGLVWRSVVVGCLAVFVASCGATDLDETTETAAERGVLRLAHELSWGGNELLDPASSAPMDWATALVFDSLVASGPNGETEPRLAHSWQPNAGATVWTFELVEGVLFHDGTTFDAADVQATFERIPGSESPLAGALESLQEVEVIDDATVAFRFSSRMVDFPSLMTDRRMRVLSSESIDGVGTGPFKVTVFDPLNTTVMTAFDDYWQGPPKLAGVEVVAMPDASSRVAAVTSGRLHVLDGVGVADVGALLGRSEYSIHQVPSGDWRGIAFDTREEPYNDPRVRQALKLVIDRNEMIELVAGGDLGAETSCDSPVAPSDPYHLASSCEHDLVEARRLLADAGYTDGLDVTITTSRLFSDWLPMVEVFQYQAAQAGIRVQIELADANGYWSNVWMNEPAVTTMWTERTAEQVLTEAFISDAPWNESFWSNDTFDEVVAAASVESDQRRRTALYRQAQQILQTDSGTIIPYHVKKSRVVASEVAGIPDGVGRYAVPWHDVSLGAEERR